MKSREQLMQAFIRAAYWVNKEFVSPLPQVHGDLQSALEDLERIITGLDN